VRGIIGSSVSADETITYHLLLTATSQGQS